MEKLNGMISDMKEQIVGEELTLVEMDNLVCRLIGDEDSNSNKNTIFDGETREFIENGEYAYSIWEDEEEGETRDINVIFEVIEDNDDELQVLVKVTDIELL